MAIDHYGKIVDSALYLPTHLVGRLAFPLFAWIIASRLALRPDLTQRYIRWLLPWALVSQPVFYIAGREWFEPNILFELLAGVVLVNMLQAYGKSARTIITAVCLAGIGWFFDYGPAGVVTIPVLYLAARHGQPRALLLLAVAGMLVNLPAADLEEMLAVGAALGAPIVAWASLQPAVQGLPRLPKVGFYLFYPLHLLVLALLRDFSSV